MAITHAVVKAPGQPVAALADWNANHTIDPNTITIAHAQFTDQNLLTTSSPTFSTLTLNGDSVNALLVENSGGTDVFQVNTANPGGIITLSYNSGIIGSQVSFFNGVNEVVRLSGRLLSRSWEPLANDTYNLGVLNGRWVNLHMSGNLTDDVVSLTVANCRTAFDHVSQSGISHTWLDQPVTIASSPTFAGLTLTGNITMPDGGTIGQAAGPLITFDDNLNFLEITGCKVGIGTAAPDTDLHIKNPASAVITLGSSDTAITTNENIGQIRWETDDTQIGTGVEVARIQVKAESAFSTGVAPVRMIFYTSADGAGLDEQMTIMSDGKVGIGTAAPDKLLSVAGDALIGQDQTGITLLRIGSDGTAADKSLSIQYDHTNNKGRINIAGDGSPLGLNIDNGGNVGIGIAAPSFKLEVAGSLGITGLFNLDTPTELTLDAAGAITVTKSYHTVDTFEDAATDNLVTINGGTEGDILILRAEDTNHDVVVDNAAGNILIGADFTLNRTADTITLIFDGTGWRGISSSNNA